MSHFGFRPCFSHVVELGVEEARQQLVAKVEKSGARCELKSFPGFICLRVPAEERRFWSPRLNLSLEDENGHTRVQGTYGPNANMWSSFLYGYLLVGSAGLFSGILGLCQWKLGMTAWGLWIFAAMAAVATGMYLMAQLGQKLGARQTFDLHRIYEEAAGMRIEIR
jgi:hypothetical protein